MNEDEGRLEQNSSLRIKLFKEISRQGTAGGSDATRTPREDWDRRQSIRTRLALIKKAETSLAIDEALPAIVSTR